MPAKIIVPVNNAGQYGLLKDIPPTELPLNAWSDGKNFRFRNGYAEKMGGHAAIYDPPSVAPYYLAPVQTPVAYYWVYLSLLKAYAYDGSVHTDITRSSGGDYNASASNLWTHCILGGVPIFNNPGDSPQMWLPVSTGTPLAALTNWPASTTAQVIRAFKSFLVALDVTKPSGRYSQMVKWSHPADPGTVPTSWDETDPTMDAGEYSMSETPDKVLDCAPLRDINVLYKENTTWGMQFIGGIDIFRFFSLFNSAGALSKRCAQEFSPGVHAVLGDDDIYQHNAQQAKSLLTRRMKRTFFARVDPNTYAKSFVAVNYAQHEVWFCIPEIGNDLPNLALVWNWDDDTVGLRDLPLTSFITPGISVVGAASDSWASDPASWDSDATTWDERLYNPVNRGLFFAVPGVTKIYQADRTNQFAGVDYTAFIERIGLGIPLRANTPPDITQQKYLTRIIPRLEGTQGATVQVSAAGMQRIDDVPVYGTPKNFVIGTTKYLDFRITGRLFAVKFSAIGGADIRLAGYELETRKSGTE